VIQAAASQFACGEDVQQNILKAEEIVRRAVSQGSNIVLLQELFSGLYFPQQESPHFFDWALPAHTLHNPLLRKMSALAKELKVVLPISFFENRNQVYYNSMIVFDADGSIIGIPEADQEQQDQSLAVYRKVHIPTGPGYEEKYYFSPAPQEGGGFRVFYSKIYQFTFGIGICWDQWFPETSRCLALLGAEMIFFPTAIGSEPQDPTIHSKHHWQTAMRGHAASNLVPIIASNRIGKENQIRFYGSSFICDSQGQFLQQADEEQETILVQSFDLDELRLTRASWGLFRDRRPELYTPLVSLDNNILTRVSSEAQNSNIHSPASSGWKMPAEWHPQDRCWITWPSDSINWPYNGDEARNAFVEVAKTISKYQPVTICVVDEWYERARKLVPENISLLRTKLNTPWIRDSGPTFVIHPIKKQIAGVDWMFNGYSGKVEFELDAQVARQVLEAQGAIRFGCPLTLEGGSIHVDGEGTLITTEECLLTRNPHLSKSDIELQLSLYLGVKKVIWLPFGLMHDEFTNGHVDNFCCFARPGEVILTYPSDKEHFQFARSHEALQILQSVTDAKNRKLKVHLVDVPVTQIVQDHEGVPKLGLFPGMIMPASYANFFMGNGCIVLPGFENGSGKDEVARKQFQEIFPDRSIEIIASSRHILLGGGNVHCITQQQPSAVVNTAGY